MGGDRFLIALAVVCLLVAVGAVGYGAGKASDVPEVVRAQRFELVDAKGEVRSELRLNDFGEGCLLLYDAEGRPQIVLGFDAGDKYAGLVLSSGNAMQPRLTLGVDPRTSRSEVRLSDRSGKLRAALELDAEGEPTLWFPRGTAEDGQVIPLDISLCDGEPRIRFRDTTGQLVWSAP